MVTMVLTEGRLGGSGMSGGRVNEKSIENVSEDSGLESSVIVI